VNSPTFVEVSVEPCAASQDGVHLRFKTAGASRGVRVVPYESESGEGGRWRVTAMTEDEQESTAEALAVLVEDSSDGAAWLVVGGTGGLCLEHVDTGSRVREPYLLLSRTTELG
jgi:hypothetical protein